MNSAVTMNPLPYTQSQSHTSAPFSSNEFLATNKYKILRYLCSLLSPQRLLFHQKNLPHQMHNSIHLLHMTAV